MVDIVPKDRRLVTLKQQLAVKLKSIALFTRIFAAAICMMILVICIAQMVAMEVKVRRDHQCINNELSQSILTKVVSLSKLAGLETSPKICLLNDASVDGTLSPSSWSSLFSGSVIFIRPSDMEKYGAYIDEILAHEIGHIHTGDSYKLWRTSPATALFCGYYQEMEFQADAFGASIVGSDQMISFFRFDKNGHPSSCGDNPHPSNEERIARLLKTSKN